MSACPHAESPMEPPHPTPLPALAALLRVLWRRDPDLLSLLPDHAYRVPRGYLGYSRRSIHVVNDPALTRPVLDDPHDIFPKSDLMVGALKPLVGDSVFVASGAPWRRQRRMIDPAFSHMRVTRAFAAMEAAVAEYEERLDAVAETGETFSLDLAMSHLTADVICRTVFSRTLADGVARDVFDAFALFERSVANVEIKRLIFDPPFADIPHRPETLAACARIRAHLGAMVDPHLAPDADFDDIAADIIAARDSETGAGFTREELIDQLGVFFLAGHETSASALTWAFFLLATQPEALARLRAEVDAATEHADGLGFEAVKRLAYVRNVFRETLRLYPPITFLPRVAAAPTRLGDAPARRGAMVMIAPWVIHRHERYWSDPARFDPDRFSPEREAEMTPGTYLPFGQGPRVCVGAGFATVEACLILARLGARYDIEVLAPESVRPAARLTTRPKREILCRVRRRAKAV